MAEKESPPFRRELCLKKNITSFSEAFQEVRDYLVTVATFPVDEHFRGHTTPPQLLAVKKPVQGSGRIPVRGHQLRGVKSEDGNNRQRKPKKGSKQEQVKGKRSRRRSHSWSKLHLIRALLLLQQAQSVFPTEVCSGNQTAELGRQGSIICHFPDGYNEVHWFDNISDGSFPVITFKPNEGDKYGQGLDSGSYDVHEDGSLIITNVSTWYERSYKAIVYMGRSSKFATFVIPLKVIASPVDDLPVIPCHNCYQDYYYIAMPGDTISCSFNATRPPVQLEWFRKSGDAYEHLEMQQFNTTENINGTFNSLATVHSLKGKSGLVHLLVCRGSWPISDWKRERKILVDFSGDISFTDVTPKVQYTEIRRYAKIQCGQSASEYVVWKTILPDSEPEIIGFHSHFMTKTVSDIPHVEVSTEGSLMFASPRVHHEGMYACIYGDGQKEEIQVASLEILIPPSPPYIQITGCDDDASHHCVIREDSTEELTCAVYGARPNVTLEWIAEDGVEISFYHSGVLKERDETFDTILSVEYKVSQDVLCGEEIVIKCHMYGPLANIMKVGSTVSIVPASCREYEVKEEHGRDSIVIAVVVLYVLFVVVNVIRLIMCYHRGRKRSYYCAYHEGPPDEPEIQNLEDVTTSVDIRRDFLENFRVAHGTT